MQAGRPLGADLAFFAAYLIVTMVIGWFSKRRNVSVGEYLNATHVMPLWAVVTAYIATNCGALEIVGLSAMAAQYGAQALHFYWVGAIPAMIFLALWMMPIYRRNNITSVPGYLLLRYGPRMRLINACITAIMLLLLAGISQYAVAQVLAATMSLPFEYGIALCSIALTIYVLLGGIRATIYNEIFQLAVIVAGLLPLAILSARRFRTLPAWALGNRVHLWRGLPLAAPHAPMDALGVTVGLGLVLSFGYWCTDFVLMQRAFTARTELEARQVPLWAGFGKHIFSMIVIVPGLVAYGLVPGLDSRYDRALPSLMTLLYGRWLTDLGITALAASLMSGLASNVSAFAALWTEDIYHQVLRPGRSDRHYLTMGRVAVVFAVIVSLFASYLNFLFANLMEHVQLIFSVFAAPFWAVFLLGIFSRRTSERGAITGFFVGSILSSLHSIAVMRGWLHYGSTMSANFYASIYAFTIAMIVGWLSSPPATLETAQQHATLRWQREDLIPRNRMLCVLSVILFASTILMNILWW